MKKFIIGLLMSLVVISGHAFGAIVSPDNVFVNADIHSSTFASKLNRNTTQMVQGINSVATTQILNGTIKAEDMADEASPVVSRNEGAVCADFIYAGLLPDTSASLTSDISAGTGYPNGVRITKASATAKTYPASKWIWLDVDTSGDFHYTETAWGAADPGVFANSARLARVSTDASTVNSVLDMRITSCTTGPFSIIADATGESTLSDVLKYGGGGVRNGMAIVSGDASSVVITPGSIYINGQYRTLTTNLTVPTNVTGVSTAGTSGIVGGGVAANTTYFVYAAADQDAIKAPVGILSSNATTPPGVTNYRKIGQVVTDEGSGFTTATADATTVFYDGNVIQRRRYATSLVKTSAATIPNDDTLPLVTEGFEFFSYTFTPVKSTSHVRVHVHMSIANSVASEYPIIALFRDGANPVLRATQQQVGPSSHSQLQDLFWDSNGEIGTTSPITLNVRAGSASGTTVMNGIGTGARVLGGSLESFITIEEYTK